MHFRASIGGRKRYVQGASAEPRGVGWQLGAGHHSMGRGATFFRLRNVVYCPSLGARLNAVFMHGLSQIACMLRPSIEQAIPARMHAQSARADAACDHSVLVLLQYTSRFYSILYVDCDE